MLAIAPALIAIALRLDPHPPAGDDIAVTVWLGIATYVWTVQALTDFTQWLRAP